MTTDLASICASAAAEVRQARASLGNACRRGTADEIASARATLQEAKIARLRADADYLQAGLPTRPDLLLVTADTDLEVRVTPEHHRLLDLAHAEACRAFVQAHPRSALDPDEPNTHPWDRDTRKAYRALLDANLQAHIALGCDLLAPCRRSNG